MYTIFFVHASVQGHLSWFYNLTIVNSEAINKGVQNLFWNTDFNSLGNILSRGIAQPYGNFISRFLEDLHTVFHNGCTNSHSPNQYINAPISWHFYQHLIFSVSFITVIILIQMKWSVIEILIVILRVEFQLCNNVLQNKQLLRKCISKYLKRSSYYIRK